MNELPAAAKRVQDAANALGLAVTVTIMPDSTRTAEEAAEACGCTVGQIVKSLIFKGKDTDQAYLFLVSGTNRVNEKAVAKTIGESIVRPDADFVRKATGFAIGGIPPFGHMVKLATFLDADLLQYETVWAAAGTPRAVFPVAPRQLRDTLVPTVIQVA
ncbi:MAG: YbaK/EbsC family protein [Bauldia sp.]|uniref:YbaK/EbsC family protein n=1 Tax=Bauldia sp. TaxID=2575872 RepID=UPI001D554661|nr:YbaK/EbsC family protein [Bauldia sp.]MCB1494535.1 YbaK/EbsC family protein [Bauldia sp.]